jgi:hypothetical protein
MKPLPSDAARWAHPERTAASNVVPFRLRRPTRRERWIARGDVAISAACGLFIAAALVAYVIWAMLETTL